jgi:hypothetical protein
VLVGRHRHLLDVPADADSHRTYSRHQEERR